VARCWHISCNKVLAHILYFNFAFVPLFKGQYFVVLVSVQNILSRILTVQVISTTAAYSVFVSENQEPRLCAIAFHCDLSSNPYRSLGV
jgi:hypothetical protein